MLMFFRMLSALFLFICLGLHFAFVFDFLRQVFSESEAHQLDWACWPGQPPVPTSLAQGLQVCATQPASACGCWRSNSDLPAYVVSAPLMEPSLQTLACFCVTLRSRLTVLSDNLSNNCKMLPPYSDMLDMTQQLHLCFLFPLDEFLLGKTDP